MTTDATYTSNSLVRSTFNISGELITTETLSTSTTLKEVLEQLGFTFINGNNNIYRKILRLVKNGSSRQEAIKTVLIQGNT